MWKIPAFILALAVVAQAQVRGTQAIPIQPPFLRRDTASRLLYARILQAEDRREYSKTLEAMLTKSHGGVRRRAAMAIGRIGDPLGIPPLLAMFDTERSDELRSDVAFALGEIESHLAAEKLLAAVLSSKMSPVVRARAIEALGKIASNQKSASALGQAKVQQIATTIAGALPPPDRQVSGDDALLASLAVTALLRLRQPSTLPALIGELSSRNSALRWQAANAIARMRPEPNTATAAIDPLLAMLKQSDPLERAHAARTLGTLKAAKAFDPLAAAIHDSDQRVQASAIRSLGALGDARAAKPLMQLGSELLYAYREDIAMKIPGVPEPHGLLMLVAEALGTLKDPSTLTFLNQVRWLDGNVGANPETELAVAAFGEAAFFDIPADKGVPMDWRHIANYAQGLGAVGGNRAKEELLAIVEGRRFGPVDARGVPDALNALAALKPENLEQILIAKLSSPDFVVRATAAQLLSDNFAVNESETTLKALEAALAAAAKDKETDARLAILDGIAKYKRQRALDLLSGALTSDAEYTVRRRAAELLEVANGGSFLSKASPAVLPTRPAGYYERLEADMRRTNPIAVVSTEKGDIRIELLIREAPMTVDNFVELARSGYFDGTAFHRVVPNFVVQGGDPRGDGNGGPGYQIRCEINTTPYDRGAVGMALSGKDTGGSQFFFTHAPQPHLDGGYTVFGRVTAGMDIVDRLMRGDRILKVKILAP